MKDSSLKMSDDAPLLNLLNKSISTMSPAELTAYVNELQEASANVAAMKSKITTKKQTTKKAKKKVDIDEFL